MDFVLSVYFNSSTWNTLCYLLMLLLSKKITVTNMKLSWSSKQSICYFRETKGSAILGFSFFPIPFLSNQNFHKINRKKEDREQKAHRDHRRCRKVIVEPIQVLSVTFFQMYPLSLLFFLFKNASAASYAGEMTGSL